MAGVRRVSKAKAMAAASAELRAGQSAPAVHGDEEEHLLCGFLQKRGDDIRGAWKKRWHVWRWLDAPLAARSQPLALRSPPRSPLQV